MKLQSCLQSLWAIWIKYAKITLRRTENLLRKLRGKSKSLNSSKSVWMKTWRLRRLGRMSLSFFKPPLSQRNWKFKIKENFKRKYRIYKWCMRNQPGSINNCSGNFIRWKMMASVLWQNINRKLLSWKKTTSELLKNYSRKFWIYINNWLKWKLSKVYCQLSQ